MNHWLKYHKEVLKEERREAALATRAAKASRTPADPAAGADEQVSNPALAQFPTR